MKKYFKIRTILLAIFVILFAGFASAGISDWFYGESWEFIESVGGVKIDEPVREPNGTINLPVRCDVSGLTVITKKPTLMNSALVVKGIDKKIKQNQILISIKTGLAKKNATCTCSGINLGNIPSGEYQVYYYGSDRQKHSLGTVTVPMK